MSDEFRKETPLTITRGRNHQYIGMQVYYTNRDQLQITMYDNNHNILNDLPPDIDAGAKTPAPNHLFSVNQEALKLYEISKSS